MRTCFFTLTLCFAACVAADLPSDAQTDAATVSAEVDRLFGLAWARERVEPAKPARDSEYLRRLYLDLAGRVPAVSTVRDFLRDDAPDKRIALVNRLLDDPAFVRHFTTVWRNALIPQANSQVQFRGLIPGFEAWLWKHLAEGRPYNEIVHEILTAELNSEGPAALAATTSPDAFFVARELRPENLASGTARAFLGVRLDCAQCHDHPFDKWSQKQFWNLAAFYAGFSRSDEDEDNVAAMMNFTESQGRRSIRIPGTDDVVPAVFLTGNAPAWQESTKPRTELADWIVSDTNPYFANVAANRVWAQFFGRGIVDPVDDFSDSNPASHPEVLQLLAEDFVASGYDIKRLVQIITGTRVYQLSSVQTDASQADPTHFARAPLRGLTPEQIFDSLAEAVGFYQPYRSENPFVVDTDSPRAQFLDLFRDGAESPLDRETTILQALAMMNGEFISTATDLDNSRTLRAVIEFPAMSTEQRLETLFMTTLTRKPTAAEAQRLFAFLAELPEADRQAGLSDIFWVLLNSSEFLLNH